MRWAWVEIDTGAVRDNVAYLCGVAGSAQVWAVVKANGYGHGAAEVARAALDGGAHGLCVALVQEGVELRAAGITAPILVLSEQPTEELADAVNFDLQMAIYSLSAIDALAAAGAHDHPVHLKIDTGMHRVGAPAVEAVALADAIERSPATRLEGVFTHLAKADEPDDPFTKFQLAAFDGALDLLAAAGHHPPLIHAANSAGLLAHPAAHFTMVRPGIAIYGIAPSPELTEASAALRPALSLHARVSMVKRVEAGEGISYGQRHYFERDTTVATVPIGYADGVPRRLFAGGGEVLIGGRRRRIVGVVTMDQLMVDCADDEVHVGDEVILIGSQGNESITANEWAEQLGTIGYEIVCGISVRIARHSM